MLKMVNNKNNFSPNVRFADSLKEFFHILESDAFCNSGDDRWNEINNKNQIIKKPQLWFRGHEDTEYKLSPNLYRKTIDLLEDNGASSSLFWSTIKNKERQLISHFKLRNFHLVESKYHNIDLLWLCTMQHYGSSTRFLDWSETVYTALYFALEKYFKNEEQKTKSVPCVWVLKPRLFNQFYFQNNGPRVNYSHIRIPNLIELDNQNIIDKTYIASFSPFNNERVKMQSGSFVVFPLSPVRRDFSPIDHYLENLPKCQDFLLKIVIVQPRKFVEQLQQIGIKTSQFYPDMPEISKEVETFVLNEP